MLIISAKSNKSSLVAREETTGELLFIEPDDNAALRRLMAEAKKHVDNRTRLECYIILKDMTSLWLLQTSGLPKEIEEKVDVFATTMEDLLAKTIFVKLPNVTSAFPSLDRTPILPESDTTVHLVIVGSSPQAEALAINAALVAHYPNYCRDTRLRTRITIIDDNVHDIRDRLIQRYTHLFENSYYRTIDLNDENPLCILHTPAYEKTRKDFVDVEWEFVNGNISNDALRQKLSEWSDDSCKQLTIAICHSDFTRNYNEAFGLPESIYKNAVPVLCHTEEHDLIDIAKNNSLFASIIPFGYDNCNIDILRILKQLAKRVNHVYCHCFMLKEGDAVTAPSDIDESLMETQWKDVGSLTKQYSNIFSAMTLGTKMHSIGHTSDDWKEYYALTLDEINTLAEVEHNRWSVEELILGYRPLDDEEQKLVEEDIRYKKEFRSARKAHYDLRAFDDLRTDATGKNVNVYDMALTQGIPLIIKTCITD